MFKEMCPQLESLIFARDWKFQLQSVCPHDGPLHTRSSKLNKQLHETNNSTAALGNRLATIVEFPMNDRTFSIQYHILVHCMTIYLYGQLNRFKLRFIAI
jgi:hypothetical protein